MKLLQRRGLPLSEGVLGVTSPSKSVSVTVDAEAELKDEDGVKGGVSNEPWEGRDGEPNPDVYVRAGEGRNVVR